MELFVLGRHFQGDHRLREGIGVGLGPYAQRQHEGQGKQQLFHYFHLLCVHR